MGSLNMEFKQMQLYITSIFLLLMVAVPSFAVVIESDQNVKAPSLEKLAEEKLSIDVDKVQNRVLREIVDLLKSGQRLEAKNRIIDFLKADPLNPVALEISGTIFLEERRYDLAQVAFEVALKQGIKNPSVLSKLGVTRILKGEFDKGKRILDLALKQQPTNPLSQRYRAWIAEQEGDLYLAFHYLYALAQRTQGGGLSLIHLDAARVAIKSENYAAGLQILEPFENRLMNPDSSLEQHGQRLYAELLVRLGRNDKADAFMKLMKPGNDYEAMRYELYQIELAISRKQSEIEKQIEGLVGEYPGYEHLIRYTSAAQYARIGDYNKSITQYKQIASLLDRSDKHELLANTLNELTALFIKQNRRIDALRTLYRYWEKYPKELKIGYQLAEVNVAMQRHKQALTILDSIKRQSKDYVPAVYLEGVIARREKRHKDAGAFFSRVNKLDPSFEPAWIQRAGNAIDKGDKDDALKILGNAANLNRSKPALWFEYGAILGEFGKYEQALVAYEHVLQLIPEHLPSLDNAAGVLLEMQNDSFKALEYAERAYRLAPSDVVLQSNYMEALLLKGRYKEVLSMSERFKGSIGSEALWKYCVGAAKVKLDEKENGIALIHSALESGQLPQRLRRIATQFQ